jgi:hypothetical protein
MTILRSPGLLAAAVLSWLPLIAIVVARFAWSGLPGAVPSHWDGSGVADAHASPGALFWSFAPAAAVLALVVTALVIAVGDDLSRRGAAVGIGAVAWVLASITGIWFVIVLVALRPDAGGAIVGGVLGLCAALGASIGGAIALPRRRRSPTIGSTPRKGRP